MKKISAALLILFLCSCSSATNYYRVIPHGSDGVAVNPDKYEVDHSKYPTLRVSKSIKPPDGEIYWISGKSNVSMTQILTSDTWMVTHAYRNLYIVQSKEYNERQCRHLDEMGRNPAGGGVNIFDNCLQAFEYGIYLNQSYEIDGGWELLPGDQKLFSARKMFLAPHKRRTEQWTERAIFEKE